MSSDIVQCPGGWETELPPVENHCSRVKSVLQPEGKWGLGGRKSNTTKPLSVRSVPGPGCTHASVCGLPAARSSHSETTCLLTACTAQSPGVSSPSSYQLPPLHQLCVLYVFFSTWTTTYFSGFLPKYWTSWEQKSSLAHVCVSGVSGTQCLAHRYSFHFGFHERMSRLPRGVGLLAPVWHGAWLHKALFLGGFYNQYMLCCFFSSSFLVYDNSCLLSNYFVSVVCWVQEIQAWIR